MYLLTIAKRTLKLNKSEYNTYYAAVTWTLFCTRDLKYA